MGDLVYLKNDEAVCDSLQVAENPEKTYFNDGEILCKTIDDVALYLLMTDDEYNIRLGINLWNFFKLDALKNYINLQEAYIALTRLGEFEKADFCRDVSLLEKGLVKGISTRFIEQAAIESSLFSIRNGINSSKDELKSLYVLEFSNNTIKIGISKDVQKRIRQICSSNGMKVKRKYETNAINNAVKLEHYIHKIFKDNRLNGEYFNIDFEKAVQAVKDNLHKFL